MIRCSNCGAELPDNARFCGLCGRTLESLQQQSAPDVPTYLSHAVDATTPATPPSGSPIDRTLYVGDTMREVATPQIPELSSTRSSGYGQSTYYRPPSPLSPRRGPRPALIVAIIVVVVVIAGVALGGIWWLTRPQPVIQVNSDYHVGALPAGATGTSFQVRGEHFAANTAVTFRLDGSPLPGVTTSDSQGNLQATLMVTTTWPLGLHTLTAQDADNNSTQQGVKVEIVPQGEAHTPGPNGAPPDDASFKLAVTLQGQYSGGQSFTETLTLIVTGHPDPSGGTVCASYSDGVQDDGQPHTVSGSSNGVPYRETVVARCQGTYKGGRLSYTREVLQDQAIFFTVLGSNTCTVAPYQTTLQGSFSDATTASGTFHEPEVDVTCSNGNASPIDQVSGSWTGHLES
jgi:hypothetical protein